MSKIDPQDLSHHGPSRHTHGILESAIYLPQFLDQLRRRKHAADHPVQEGQDDVVPKDVLDFAFFDAERSLSSTPLFVTRLDLLRGQSHVLEHRVNRADT